MRKKHQIFPGDFVKYFINDGAIELIISVHQTSYGVTMCTILTNGTIWTARPEDFEAYGILETSQ